MTEFQPHKHNARQLLTMSWPHMQYIERNTTKALLTAVPNFSEVINQGWWGHTYLCGPLGSSMWSAIPHNPSTRSQQGIILRRSSGHSLVISWIDWINIVEAGEVIDSTKNDKYLVYSVSKIDKKLVLSTLPSLFYLFEAERKVLDYIDSSFDFPIGIFSVKDNITFYFDWVPLNNLTKKMCELLLNG